MQLAAERSKVFPAQQVWHWAFDSSGCRWGNGHDFENDGELDFESFQRYVELRTSWGAASKRNIQLPLLLAIANVLQDRLDHAGIAVYDVQILLARYVERDGMFVDVLSGTSLLDYESHLRAVWSRCPRFGKPAESR
ncbi:hypothetical protein [Saccharopolyspora sp. 5N708]|uniref:hypothetical protein n=1 Tax=Saccharopolyspora sp. 5N708 TaxID=3457424 RepID=UPI003FD3EBAD